MSNLPEVLSSAVLAEDEILVLVCDEMPTPNTVWEVPEKIKGRVLFVVGAEAYTVVEECAEEIQNRVQEGRDEE